jgi:hypothetical protein
MTNKWTNRLLIAMEQASHAHSIDPTQFKSNLMFIHRSFMSPHLLFAPSVRVWMDGMSSMMEAKLHFKTTTILCSASEYASELRRQHRFSLATTSEQVRLKFTKLPIIFCC